MSQKILITGGAGFIGSHLVDVCLNAGHTVLVYDNFSVGNHTFLQDHPSLKIVEGDILDASLLAKTVQEFNPEVLYHLAAIHFIPACENDPAMALRINVEGTQNVLMACRNAGIKIIFTSTGAIYDPALETVLSEDSNIDTRDIYGLTKHTAERLVQYHVTKGFGSVVIARLFNAAGRRETNPHLLPAIMEQISRGDKNIELGNLYPRRDYIHVEDIAEALYSVRTVNSIDYPAVFNIGSGKEYSVKELVDICSETINESLNIIQVPSRIRKLDRPSQLAGISAIWEATGWKPRRTLGQAVQEIWSELASKQKFENA